MESLPRGLFFLDKSYSDTAQPRLLFWGFITILMADSLESLTSGLEPRGMEELCALAPNLSWQDGTRIDLCIQLIHQLV